jgi:signal transduction histidine kinase
MDKDKIMDHLKKIRLAVDDMTDTLDDFLSVERIEAGNMQPDHKPFDLLILAEELTEQIRQQAKPGVHIMYRHTGEESVVSLDRTMLRHCLVNLLSNALKYSNDIGLIEFETVLTDKKCTIIVRDHGIGIPAKDQPHLFDAFFRAGNTTGIQGTGLGLNIVKNYVGLMGGTITFSSRENKGTTFTMNFDASATA